MGENPALTPRSRAAERDYKERERINPAQGGAPSMVIQYQVVSLKTMNILNGSRSLFLCVLAYTYVMVIKEKAHQYGG